MHFLLLLTHFHIRPVSGALVCICPVLGALLCLSCFWCTYASVLCYCALLFIHITPVLLCPVSSACILCLFLMHFCICSISHQLLHLPHSSTLLCLSCAWSTSVCVLVLMHLSVHPTLVHFCLSSFLTLSCFCPHMS